MSNSSITLKRFFVDYSQFFSSQAISVLFGLLSFPILTRALTAEQYGVLSLVNVTIALAVAIIKCGTSEGIIRFYSDFSETQSERIIFVSTVVYSSLAFSLCGVLIYLGIVPFLIDFLGISPQYAICFYVMAGYLLVRPINIVGLNLLRINGKVFFLNILNLLNRFITVCAALVLLLFVVGTLYGYFIGFIVGESLMFSVLAYWFFGNFKLVLSEYSKKLIRSLVLFGIPLLFSEMAYLLLSYCDRYMIVALLGEQAVGLYSVGYNLSMYVANIVTFSLSYAVVPLFVRLYREKGLEETEKFLSSCLNYLLIGILPITFGYYAVSEDLFFVLASEKYVQAAGFSVIVLVGNLILGLNGIMNAGLYLKKKSIVIMSIMLCSVAINIGLNLFLIPKFQLIGAAVSTLIACSCNVAFTVFLSSRILKIIPRWWKLTYHAALSVCMFFVVGLVQVDIVWQQLILKISVGGVIIISGVALLEPEITRKIFKVMKSLNRK